MAVGKLAGRAGQPAEVLQHLKILKNARPGRGRGAGYEDLRLKPVGGGATGPARYPHGSGPWLGRRICLENTDRGGLMTQTGAATSRLSWSAIERAFTVFTDRFGDFKPPEHNLLGAPIAETVFEARVGGVIVDRAPTAPSAGGRASWPTTRPTGWCSAGTSAHGGPSRPTRPRLARSRSGSTPRPPTVPGSSWNTATSTSTVPGVGSRRPRASRRQAAVPRPLRRAGQRATDRGRKPAGQKLSRGR